jgi:hypothetical protein
MTAICERRVVQCPNHKASQYLAALVADRQVGDGSVHLALRRPIRRFADRRRPNQGLVVATLSLQSMDDLLYPAYCVSWLPNGDGPSPEFAGTLAVEKCRRADCFGLILSGDYQPFAAVGEPGDAKRDRRFARVSAREVLRAIADYVTDARAHNEAALAGHSRYVSAVRG